MKTILSIAGFFLCMLVAAQNDTARLWEAATKNDVRTIQAMLDKGIDVNIKTVYGTTALTFAAFRGNTEAVKLLLEHGANPNVRDAFYGATPLLMSLDKKNHDVIKLMIVHGADLSSGDVLQSLVDLGMNDLVELALGKNTAGADKSIAIAARNGNAEILRELLEVSKPSDEILANALFIALTNNKSEPAEILKQAGAKLPESQARAGEGWLNKHPKGIFKRPDGNSVELGRKDSLFTISFEGWPPNLLRAISDTCFEMVEYTELKVSLQEIGGQVISLRIIQPGNVSLYMKVTVQPSQVETNDKASMLQETSGKVLQPLNWAAFRGNNNSGLADGQYPPLGWDAGKGSNLLWKTYIPGLAHSSPVIWGNKVFITTAMSGDTAAEYRVGLFGDVAPAVDSSIHIWKIYCLDKNTGKLLWEKKAYEGIPRVKRHVKGSQANATPVTNGEFLVAIFGSEGMVCYDLNGNERWRKDLGLLDAGWFFEGATQWGPASSPVIYKNTVIVQCDRSKDSYIAAYDLATGKEAWRDNRDEVSSWGTPVIYFGKTHDELVSNATRHIRGYNPKTGEELWRLAPNSEVTVGSPVVSDSLFIVTGGYPPVYPIYAIKAGGKGDISIADSLNAGPFIQWRNMRGGTYMPTPIVYNGFLYTLANQGVLTCYDAHTGERKYRETVKEGKSFSASPVAADGKLYLTSEEHGVIVVKAGPEFEILAQDPVGEICMATPAISDGKIFIRAQHHVFCFGK